MTKPAGGAILTTLSVHPDPRLPLHRQLYLRIRELILDGALVRGARLPSSRTLARELDLSRNTVLNAVEQLVAEGYLVSRVGDGTYVASAVPEDERPRPQPRRAEPAARSAPPRLSRRGEALRAAPASDDALWPRPFAVGVPALDAFPWSLWQRVWQRHSRSVGPEVLGFGDPAGWRPLREAIASYLTTARGVRCTADHVVVVSSTQQAIDLAARVLVDPGDEVWMEEPGYLGARGALAAAGAVLTPVRVDAEGLDVAEGVERAPRARLAYVTPSHQFPTGSTLSLSRRLALLDWAARTGAWVIEDDYDSEYRYSGRPLAALQGLDRSGAVVYVGTFTKVLYPSLRLAYAVLPEHLVETFLAARGFVDRHAPTLPQLVLAEFMAAGHFGSHLRRMRALYRSRRTALLEALAELLGDRVRPRPDDAGMHLVIDLPAEHDAEEVRERGQRHGIDVLPLSRYRLTPDEEGREGLLLGYACVPEESMREAVERLAQAL